MYTSEPRFQLGQMVYCVEDTYLSDKLVGFTITLEKIAEIDLKYSLASTTTPLHLNKSKEKDNLYLNVQFEYRFCTPDGHPSSYLKPDGKLFRSEEDALKYLKNRIEASEEYQIAKCYV